MEVDNTRAEWSKPARACCPYSYSVCVSALLIEFVSCRGKLNLLRLSSLCQSHVCVWS